MVLICISLTISDVWHLFMYLLAFSMHSLVLSVLFTSVCSGLEWNLVYKIYSINSCGKNKDHVIAFFFFLIIYLFIYVWLCWVFVSVRGLSLFAVSGGHSSSRRAGPSLSRPLLLRSTGSRRAGSVVVAHGPSCSAARGIFPDQGSNPCPRHWQADSQPPHHQGSPM